MQLSVIIITFNEENNIQRCLNSVRGIADEVVVVDSGSEDNTKTVCRQMAAKVYDHPFRSYGLQKEFATRLTAFDHILSLDADEELSEELRDSISRVKLHWEKDCYSCHRITNFCGQWILHGEWFPDKVIRLFDRRKAKWIGNIHEKIVPYDRHNMGDLRGELLHYSYHSLNHFRIKSEKYAAMSARELYRQGVYPGFYHFYIKPAYRFLSAFLLRRGFMDGNAGYHIARLTADRVYMKYEKLKQMHEQKEDPSADI